MLPCIMLLCGPDVGIASQQAQFLFLWFLIQAGWMALVTGICIVPEMDTASLVVLMLHFVAGTSSKIV